MDEIFAKNEHQILKQIHDMSDDNDSELSFSDLINEYNSNRVKNLNMTDLEQKSSCSDDSYVKVDVEDKSSHSGNIVKNLSEPLNVKRDAILVRGIQGKAPETSKLDKASSDNDSSERNHSDINFEENFDTHLVLPEKNVVKWAAQLLLALEKLHVLGVICR